MLQSAVWSIYSVSLVSAAVLVSLILESKKVSQSAEMEKQHIDSPFWNKRVDVALRIRDADGDGMITQSYFEAAVKRFSAIDGIKRQSPCLPSSHRKTVQNASAD